MRPLRRWRVAVVMLAISSIACDGGRSPASKIGPKGGAALKKPLQDLPRNEIPADQLAPVMAAHFDGLGQMERYKYGSAAIRFRDVHECAPDWIPGSINLAIALLNQAGEKIEAEKKAGRNVMPEPGSRKSGIAALDQALDLLKDVLDRDPDNCHAHFCRGLILQQFPDRIAEAHDEFVRVATLDPRDPHAWLRAGLTTETSIDHAKDRIKFFGKAVECNPYLAPALYNLAFAYRLDGQPEKQAELLALFQKMKTDQPPNIPAPGPADSAGTVYGEMGRYATIIDPFPARATSEGQGASPRFDAATPIRVTLADDVRWAKEADFTGPLGVVARARARFGPAVAAFDADGDGRTDLFMAAAVFGRDGVRDALLLNRGDGQFEDVTLAFGFPSNRASLGAAAADFDADRNIDLFLTGVGNNRLYRNLGTRRFEDVTKSLNETGPRVVSLAARWLDLDQDGDLDLYVVNHCTLADQDQAFADGATPKGAENAVYRNDGQPVADPRIPIQAAAPIAVASASSPAKGGLTIALTPWPGAEILKGGEAPHNGIAALDIDNDRDLDLVLSADGQAPTALLNDRLGRFHPVALPALAAKEPGNGLLSVDVDKDGRIDLVAVNRGGPVRTWRNATARDRPDKDALTFEEWPIDARDWHAAVAADLDLDGWHDLIGLPAGEDVAAPAWSRNEGKRFATSRLPLGLTPPGLTGFAYADLVGDPLPDLLTVQPGEPPDSRNQGNGNHWIALELGGHWRVKPELMRTNPHAIGARILVEGPGVHVPYDLSTQESGLSQSIGPVVLGLGEARGATLIHATWPDGVLQCELNPRIDQKQKLAENNRKTGSCPVLFTWNGERFVCLGDFLGGGGLGYLVAPGVYGQPDRDESVGIAPDQLREQGGVYKLSVTEPMDEVAYLDRLALEVIDRPPGLVATPDERFAPEGPRPTGEVIAWKRSIEPVRATDLAGADVTELLRSWDRRTVDGFSLRHGWIGYAEEHGIVLDFGDRLGRFGPTDSLVLCLAGWVEYPYSQTNYAAATAGVALKPPSLERRRPDGTWEVIMPHAGYPAGMPRMTTLDLTGQLTGERCVIRLRTNMECYWDQAFVAVRDRNAGVRVTALPVARAELGFRGYTREVSPDGRLPLLYDYDYVDPAPLARLEGRLTRFGAVARLLRTDDDQFCVVGPGDEVRLEFDARKAPRVPDGWTRSYVLRAVGYCKDADPFTATSDSIGPLPWCAMPAEFPLSSQRTQVRPLDEAYRAYMETFQTRSAGER